MSSGRAPSDQPDQGATRPDPRFVLANERTFLAWNRTALALIAGGLAAARFLPLHGDPLPLVIGLALILFGGYIAWSAMRRWRSVERALRRGEQLPPSRLPGELTGGVIAFSIAALALAAILYFSR